MFSFCLLLFVNYLVCLLNLLTLVHPLACTADSVHSLTFAAPNLIKTILNMSHRTSGAVRAEPCLHELCRVVTEEDEVNARRSRKDHAGCCIMSHRSHRSHGLVMVATLKIIKLTRKAQKARKAMRGVSFMSHRSHGSHGLESGRCAQNYQKIWYKIFKISSDGWIVLFLWE